MNPKTTLALALGITPGDGCRCAACGESPFDPAGPSDRVLGKNFTDHESLVDPRTEEVCKGCQYLLSGRPGRKPPPLRTISVWVDVERPELVELDMAAWWSLLTGETEIPASGSVLSWATSRKRHHWLRAGISTPETWAVGADAGTIVWCFDPGLAAAVLSLREIGAGKGSILAGIYPPRLMAEHRDRVLAAEQILAPLRGPRPSKAPKFREAVSSSEAHPILDLVVWAAPRVETTEPRPEGESMIDPSDAAAAGLIAEIAWGSSIRATEGMQFWGGVLIRRLRRFARLPLADLVSRLVGECQVGVSSASQAAEILARLSEEETEAIECSIRERTDLIHALAFDRVQGIRTERKKETS